MAGWFRTLRCSPSRFWLVSAAYAGDRRIWPGPLLRGRGFWVARHYAAMRSGRMAARQLRRWRQT